MHRHQPLHRHARVELRAREERVAEQRLQVPDVRAGIVHECRHRVPEDVTTPRLSDARCAKALAHPARHHLRGDAPPTSREKERGLVCRLRLADARRLHVAGHPVPCAATQRDEPCGPTLAASHTEHAARLVEVVHIEPDELDTADAGGLQDLEHRAISQAGGGPHARRVEDRLDLVGREDLRRSDGRAAEREESFAQVARDESRPERPGEELACRRKHADDRVAGSGRPRSTDDPRNRRARLAR